MSFATNIPPFYAYVHSEYLYNLESHKGEIIPCFVFAADSVFGRAVGFDIITDCGAMFARLPISAIIHKTDAPDIPLDYLQLWNNLSYSFESIEYLNIRGMNCEVILKDRNWYPGSYMFTFNWMGNTFSDDAGDTGFKRAHLIKLDNGCFALQPNNRIRWSDMAFITKPFPKYPDFKTNENNWETEQTGQWVTEDSGRYFYDINKKGE